MHKKAFLFGQKGFLFWWVLYYFFFIFFNLSRNWADFL
jgi:hypothetical protein